MEVAPLFRILKFYFRITKIEHGVLRGHGKEASTLALGSVMYWASLVAQMVKNLPAVQET